LLSPELRQQGWSMQSEEGEWYYVGRVITRDRPSRGWPAAQLLGRDQADELYKEAVAVAVAKCAKDTAGQTCYICYGEGDEDGLVRGCACRGESGIAHISCLAEQARRLVVHAEAEARDLDDDALDAAWKRWCICGLCEQDYHGVVSCALGWACWKTYLGRREEDEARNFAMTVLGNGLYAANYYEDALSVQKAELSMRQRLGDAEDNILAVQTNLANTYRSLGRLEEALRLRQEVYSRYLKLNGKEHGSTLLATNNYAVSLNLLERFEEARSLLRRTISVARRVLGESHDLTLNMRKTYAIALYCDKGATLDDLRESVTTLEDAKRIARRVLGGEHPTTTEIEWHLQEALRAHETSDDETLDVSAQEDDADDIE